MAAYKRAVESGNALEGVGISYRFCEDGTKVVTFSWAQFNDIARTVEVRIHERYLEVYGYIDGLITLDSRESGYKLVPIGVTRLPVFTRELEDMIGEGFVKIERLKRCDLEEGRSKAAKSRAIYNLLDSVIEVKDFVDDA